MRAGARLFQIAVLFLAGVHSVARPMAQDLPADVNTLGLPLPQGFWEKQFAPAIAPVTTGLPKGHDAWSQSIGLPCIGCGGGTPSVIIGADQIGFFNPNDTTLSFQVTIAAAPMNVTLVPRQIITLACSPCTDARAVIGTGEEFENTAMTGGTLYLLRNISSKWALVSITK